MSKIFHQSLIGGLKPRFDYFGKFLIMIKNHWFLTLVLKAPFILFMVEPFQNNAHYFYFISFNGVDKPPSVRKVVFPEICDLIFLNILFRPEIFRYFNATKRVGF